MMSSTGDTDPRIDAMCRVQLGNPEGVYFEDATTEMLSVAPDAAAALLAAADAVDPVRLGVAEPDVDPPVERVPIRWVRAERAEEAEHALADAHRDALLQAADHAHAQIGTTPPMQTLSERSIGWHKGWEDAMAGIERGLRARASALVPTETEEFTPTLESAPSAQFIAAAERAASATNLPPGFGAQFDAASELCPRCMAAPLGNCGCYYPGGSLVPTHTDEPGDGDVA